MKLFSWQPKGHGPVSFFVASDNQEEATKAVRDLIEQRGLLPFGHLDRLDSYDTNGWPENYELTIVDQNVVLTNQND